MPRALRFLVFVTVLALFCQISAVAAPCDAAYFLPTPGAEAPQTSAAAAVLLDVASGALLVQKNASERLPMASTTKIMTALVALDILSPDTVVSIPREAVGVEGSSIYLYEGERITVKTLLYALLLSSANDAAAALAIEAAGSIQAFADLMNAKATALGLADTHFCNPHGLHDAAHYTTARDLAVLTAAALADTRFAEIVSTPRYTAKQDGSDATRLFLNHNRLLRSYEGAIGVKTGFTKAAGRCLVSAAQRDGLTLVAVTLNAPNDWRDHTALLDFGFAEYEAFCPTPQAVALPVVGGTRPSVTLSPAPTPCITLPRNHAEIDVTVELPRFLYGDFQKGVKKGRILYRLEGKTIAEVPLVTDEASERLPESGFWARIKSTFKK